MIVPFHDDASSELYYLRHHEYVSLDNMNLHHAEIGHK